MTISPPVHGGRGLVRLFVQRHGGAADWLLATVAAGQGGQAEPAEQSVRRLTALPQGRVGDARPREPRPHAGDFLESLSAATAWWRHWH